MGIRFRFSSNVRVVNERTDRRGVAVLAGAALLAAAIFLVWLNFDFGRYAFTAFFWDETEGTVVSPRTTSGPTIQFATRDGALHSFTEDYILLCGRLSFCFPRNFDHGEVVPVVYDPATPQRAYVVDWALYSNVITWFVEVGLALLLALMFVVALTNKPLSIRIGNRQD